MPDELNVITSRPDTQTAMPSHCDNADCVSLPLLRRSRCQCLNMPKTRLNMTVQEYPTEHS